MKQRALKYPETSHLDELEEKLGIAIDETFLKGQRAALQRIQSERLGRSNSSSLIRCMETDKYQSVSCRCLSSTYSGDSVIKDDPGRIVEQPLYGTSHQEEPSVDSNSHPVACRGHGRTQSGALQIHTRTAPKRHSFVGSASLPHSSEPAAGDRAGHFRSGKKVIIKGASHVYSDIARGNAVLVNCPCCGTVLQVGKSTVNLFCSVCQRISPMDTISRTAPHRSDDEIASNVQKQEYEVAYMRVQAKEAG